MSLNKKHQDILETALSSLEAKEAILNELQQMRDAFNALLAKLDADSADTGGDSDYEGDLAIDPIREKDEKTEL